jgi:hypothetical protein
MEVEQCYVIKLFSDEGRPTVQVVACVKQHYGEGAVSRTQVFFGINEVKRAGRIISRLRAPEESLMKILPLLLLESSMPILIFQLGSLHSPWELQPQRFVNI